jgi:hypothetical protein
VLVPCRHTLASVCPSCAERARSPRAAQCREGWHLDRESIVQAGDADDEQRMWVELRSDAQRDRDQADASGEHITEDDAAIGDLDEQITRSGMRGDVLPARPVRRHRSARRGQDTPDLPRRKVAARTVRKTYPAPDGKTFLPSTFVTLTCPGYGRVGATVRGTPSRPGLRQVLSATYHQVWWSTTDTIKHDDAACRSGMSPAAATLDPATGEVLPIWDQALDVIGPEDEPQHVARFGERPDAQGVIAGHTTPTGASATSPSI